MEDNKKRTVKRGLILTCGLIFSIIGISYAETGNSLYKFEQSKLVENFGFLDRTTQTLETGEKAHYLYKNKEGHLIEVILNKEGKIRKQTLATYTTKSGSTIKIVAPSLISEFVNEASRGQIDPQQFNKMLNVGINERGTRGQLSGFNVEIVLAELWGEYEGIGLVTVTITKIPIEEKTRDIFLKQK